MSSRRRFLAAATTSAAALATGWAAHVRSVGARPRDPGKSPLGTLSLLSARTIQAAAQAEVHLQFTPDVAWKSGGRLWMFYDIRQGAAAGQIADADGDNFVSVSAAGRADFPVSLRSSAAEGVLRTLDLYPTAPEFLHMVQITLRADLAVGTPLDVRIARWQGPEVPINPYQFWFVADPTGEWEFAPIDFRRYHRFVRRGSGERVEPERVLGQVIRTGLQVDGAYAAVPEANRRQTPGIYWGELHGMAFNQRPLDDFYNYAKQVSRLDFCCPCLFSYNTCIGETWQQVKDAAVRHAQPGRFVPIVGFECGSVPDGSHRCAYFPDPGPVPPIFCEDRRPAQETAFRRRLHPKTVLCDTLQALYDTVKQYNGIVTGHHHTLTYDREHLAEMWQKQRRVGDGEEARVFALLREGKRFGLVAGSDTHDSMPGNPWPEPHCPSPSGLTAVLADRLSPDALWPSLLARRVYATTGARIVVQFRSNRQVMGAELPLSAPRRFEIQIEGTARLERVELLKNGVPMQQWSPDDRRFDTTAEDHGGGRQPAFYLVRTIQTDKHRAWTSPIWFG